MFVSFAVCDKTFLRMCAAIIITIIIIIIIIIIMIKTTDKKLRRFDLPEVIFKCELKMCE